MRRFSILSFLLWIGMAHAVDINQIRSMLAVAADANGRAYIETRRAILDMGAPAKPLLLHAAGMQDLTWQQRVVARICYERMTRGEEIQALRRYRWPDHPQYDKRWEEVITGPVPEIGGITVPEFVKAGIWYYYLEVCWKKTQEWAIEPFDQRMNIPVLGTSPWQYWCMDALKTPPERHYLVLCIAERIQQDRDLREPENQELYQWLFENKQKDAIPVVLQWFPVHFRRALEQGRSAHFIAEKNFALVCDMLQCAGPDHADLLEKFCREQEFLVNYQDKLAPLLQEVRSRPHKELLTEPPFYLATPAQPPP